MTTTQATLDLINLALADVQEQPLIALTERRKAASLAVPSYRTERRALLRRGRWQFALRRAVLAPEVTTPAFGFAYQHLLPADFVAVVGAYPDAGSARINLTGASIVYRIENGRLLTDQNVVYLLYVSDVEDPAAFDPLFSKTLVSLLAARFALSLKNDDERSDMLRKRAADEFVAARRAGAIEQSAEQMDTEGRVSTEGRLEHYPGRLPRSSY
jgi:hypothetical protein